MAAYAASAPYAAARKRVLVVGSGYVAQHVVAALKEESEAWEVAYTHRRERAPFAVAGVSALSMDVLDVAGCCEALWDYKPDAVVNCAAVSSPAACERDEARALATNCPLAFLEALFATCPDALLVHCSTDLVLEGKDEDGEEPYGDGGASAGRAAALAAGLKPAGAYGRTKAAFEAALAASWPRCVVLRMSNVVGGPAPFTGEGKFAQWVRGQLAAGEAVTLWRDETRNFVDVRQVCRGVAAAVKTYAVAHAPADAHEARALANAARSPAETTRYAAKARALHPPVFLHLNCGGPETLSRAQLGRAIAAHIGADAGLVLPAPRPAGGVPAPLKAPINSDNFAVLLRVPLVPIDDALAEAFADAPRP